jgi:hypothetical protein
VLHILLGHIVENHIYRVFSHSMVFKYGHPETQLILTDEIIESKQGADELAFSLHDHPYTRSDTFVDQF